MKQTANTDASHAPGAATPRRPRPTPAVAPGGRLAQMAAMLNGAPQVQPLAQLKDDIQQSPRVQSLIRLATEIHQGAPPQLSGDSASQNDGLEQGADAMEANAQIPQRQPAQLYTSAGGKKLSANADYYVKDGDDEKLFVKAGAGLGNRGGQIVATGATETYNLATYTAYHYYADDSGGFVNDCLGLAEQLARSSKVGSLRGEFRAPGTGGGEGKLFGDTHPKDTEIAQDSNWYQDEDANPDIGEAYAIAPTVLPDVGEAPYHAAAVIAKDGADNITLEADAGTHRSRPLFDMYDTQPPGTRVDKNSKTFHEVYAKGFTYKRTTDAPGKKGKKKRKVTKSYAPSTGVLKLRTD